MATAPSSQPILPSSHLPSSPHHPHPSDTKPPSPSPSTAGPSRAGSQQAPNGDNHQQITSSSSTSSSRTSGLPAPLPISRPQNGPPPAPHRSARATKSGSLPPPPPPPPFLGGPIPIHSETPLFAPLIRDQEAVLNPDYRTPFRDARDVVARLLPYHVWQVPQDVIDLAKGLNQRTQGKGKQKAIENSARDGADQASGLESPALRKRKRSGTRSDGWMSDITRVPRMEKAGQSSMAAFDRIEGLDFPRLQDIEAIIPRFESIRSAVRRVRHRVTGGEKATSPDPADELAEPAPAYFSKEAHLQLLRLSCAEDQSELDETLEKLRQARTDLLTEYGQQWLAELDQIAPGLNPPAQSSTASPAPPSAKQAASSPVAAKESSSGMQSWPTTNRGASPERPSKRATSPNNKRQGMSPATPAGGPGSRGPYRKKVPPAQQQQQQQQEEQQEHKQPPPPISKSTQQQQQTPATPSGGVHAPPRTSQGPASVAAAAVPAPARAPPPPPPLQPPIRIILPLSLIGKLTSVGIAPLPAPHLQPAIEAHKRRAAAAAASGSAVPTLGDSSKAEAGEWTTAPCEPDPNQTEAAILLGITEAEAPGGKGEWHQLVHLSLVLGRLDSNQLTALAEVVAMVQTQGGGTGIQSSINGTAGANGVVNGAAGAGAPPPPLPSQIAPPAAAPEQSLEVTEATAPMTASPSTEQVEQK
ncbi:hypothetical protein BCV69DRAFT_280318 [Microstroma glucosiphilum]|uniref:GLTSCR protein conserved domain-containing protein n=1 Tax=Pseudomicrostroma glucosiphilum TaxID=1684307 RepID=A0A316UD01_9BASI|nr:hypothetical protein BCV69DRAFT_280318 [Pseudomicrostroma glucosiphilum]PWN22714.1 hypothetical protein BCV69DRAFT_280318 [Pseudomicrostroma glucosiphilum]